MSNSKASHDNPVPQDNEKIDECRKRYFATLLQSYLGKAGDQETDWLYSYLKKCEECNFHKFMGAGTTEALGEEVRGAPC